MARPPRRSDTYFGGYSRDAKAGAGLYVFSSGAAYLGAFAAGLRSGRGVMALPDGGAYEGEWAADKFDGQARFACRKGRVLLLVARLSFAKGLLVSAQGVNRALLARGRRA